MKNIDQYGSDHVNRILIGNKCDIMDKKVNCRIVLNDFPDPTSLKVISKERGQALANEFGLKFLETSAKTNINVEQAFISLTKEVKARLIDPQEAQGMSMSSNQSKNVKLSQKNDMVLRKNCCSGGGK